MDQALTCNNLKCRAELVDRALVTTCSHIFCLDCTNRFCLSGQDIQNRVPCPACDTQLASPDDAVISNLKPSEAYKTSVLSGLSPSIIMECAGRALSFWAYQTTQNIFYQQYLYKTLTEKFAALNGRLEQTVNEANSQIDTLQRKIDSLAAENDNTRRKNEELSKAYKEKNRQLLQTQELHDKLRHTVDISHIQRAATDAIDSRFQQSSRPFAQQPHHPLHDDGALNASSLHVYGGPSAEHGRSAEGHIRGGIMDNGTSANLWRRDGSATGQSSNGPGHIQRFGARAALDQQRGGGLGSGNVSNCAEARRTGTGSFRPFGVTTGGFSSGIRVSQPMVDSGIQPSHGGFTGI